MKIFKPLIPIRAKQGRPKKPKPIRLHLTLKKQFFDLILSGDKKEEYRDIKGYWSRRLEVSGDTGFKKFHVIVFKNGYQKKAPTMVVEMKGIEIGLSKPEWCNGITKECYILKLGEIIRTENIKEKPDLD